MMTSKKKVCSSNMRNSVVLLERLPMWISEQKSVKVFIKSQEFVITSLPSSPTWHQYRSMNSFCGSNFLELPNLDMKDGKRLTRSAGESVKVDFNAKLPDDRNYRCKILGACSYPFLGFESCHHAIYLSNNEVFQFLSKVEDKMDFVLSMVITDMDCTEEELKRSASLTDEQTSRISGSRSSIVKYEKYRNRKKVKRSYLSSKGSPGWVAFQSNGGDHCTTVNGLLNSKEAECSKDFCRLGCMCDSLKSKMKRTHCGHADCMFSKKCIGPNSTHNESSRLTLLSLPTNSPENQEISAKRPRRPPKRWLEEEEEMDLIAEAKKKSKLFIHASPPKDNVSGSVYEVNGKVDLSNTNGKCLVSMDSSCSQNENTSQPKRTISVAIKSTSGRLMHKVSPLKKSVMEESSVTNVNIKRNLFDGNTSSCSNLLPKIALLNAANKPDTLSDYIVRTIIARKYFRNNKEYRKILTSLEVNKNHLVTMCTSFLSPLLENSIRLMKWEILEEKVRENSVFLWLSQIPKCAAKLYVSVSELPPDPISINLKNVGNVCGIQSSIDYFFQLYKKQPEHFGCCVLVCQGIFWEIKGNLNMESKVTDRILFKVVRSCAKGMKELTFANSGKKILISDTSRRKLNEDALSGNYVPDDLVESEINEIPEPDIQLYDSTSGHNVGSSIKAETEESSDLAHPVVNSTLDTPVNDSALAHPSEDSTHLNPASLNHGHTSPDTTMPEVSYQEEVFTRGMQSTTSIMPTPMPRSLMELSWYCLNLDKSFDKIIIDKPNFSATYTQMVYALKVSREKNIAVRITCPGGSNYMFNSQIWRQGVYADYTLSDIAVKIGPYYNYEVPDIRAFVKVNGILCRTYVQLSKEPLMLETMPRVTKKKPNDNKVIGPSPSCDKKLELEKRAVKKVEARCMQDVSSTVGKNLVPAIASSSTSIALRTNKSPPSEMKHACSEPSDTSDFSIKIESVRGNWSGFDDIVNPSCVKLSIANDKVVTTKSMDSTPVCVVNPPPDNLIATKSKVVATTKSIAPTIAQICHVKSGFLVPKIPTLIAVAVTKGVKNVKDSKCITMMDPSWNANGNPLTFKSEEAACNYLNSITKVKLYPDDYKVEWTFAEDKKYFQMNEDKGIHDIRKLTEDQFITPKGIFSYDDVCYDNLTEYGLETIDNRRLLEFRRRRDIRDAKHELINLLPEPKTDVLVKVIYRSWSLIRSLEEKGKVLLESLITENARKGALLAKLRKMCSGEAMYQIFEQLEKISRPRKNTDLDYESIFPKPNSKKRKPRRPRKPRASKWHKGKRRATSHKNTKKQPVDSAPTPPVTAERTLRSVKVLKPVEAVELVSPAEEPHGPQHTQNTDVSSAQPVKEPSKTRNLFSGRYVSAATKRSLRKYNYIIPCLARKQHSVLKKSVCLPEESKVPTVGVDYQMIPIPSIFKKVIIANKEEIYKDKIEDIPLSMDCCEGLDQFTTAETSSNVITGEYVVSEPNVEESNQLKELVTNSTISEEHSLKNPCNIIVKQEIFEDADEYDDDQLEAYENLPSEESFIDVGTKEDLQPVKTEDLLF